jgi:YidC/Oxa1 family membrane protein insertase
MDKRSFFGFLLIALVIIFLPKYYEWVNPEYANRRQADTIVVEKPAGTQPPAETKPAEQIVENFEPSEKTEKLENDIEDKTYKIETDLYKLILSNKAGGTISSIKLKEHHIISGGDTSLVELINQSEQQSPYVSFINPENGLREKLLYNFQLDDNFDDSNFLVSGKDSLSLRFSLNYNGKTIRRNYTFYGNKYQIGIINDLSEISNSIATENYQLCWEGGINYTEKDIDDENRYAMAYAHTAPDELEKFKTKDTEFIETSFSGHTNWSAIRNKYFAIAMVPKNPANGFELSAYGKMRLSEKDDKEKLNKYFGMQLSIPKYTKVQTKLYIGPLKQANLKSLNKDLDNIMSFGAAFIRPISKAVLWLFTNMYKVIPNYGFVLILFSVLVKILLHPLTVKSTQSMKEMHKLQPKINELKEKYSDDAQKLNQETMKLYSEHGVNPMGGCLPLILQMPILFALFTVFRTTIQLRHAPFIFWITDLSSPDALFTLPFAIPFYGQHVNILPMIMVASQILMQKMSGQNQNPQQKQMALIMPIMFFFIFNNFPSGLNLYYTLFNILTIVQQQYFTPEPKPKEKKIKKRKSRLERMRELQQKRKQFK